MKKTAVAVLIMVLFYLVLFAIVVKAAPPPGTNVGGIVAPSDSSDVYATHNALWGKGGWREVYDTVARNAIPALRRDTGMVVFTYLDSTAWQLRGGIGDEHWKPLRVPVASNADSLGHKPPAYYDTVGHGMLGGLYLKLDQTTPQSVINGDPYFTSGLKTPNIYPNADGTTALQIMKADGSTPIFTFDTQNDRVAIGQNIPTNTFDAYDPILSIGESAVVSAGINTYTGIKIGVYRGVYGYFSGLWLSQSSISLTNYAFLYAGETIFNTPALTNMYYRVGNVNALRISSSRGMSFGSTFYATDPGLNKFIIESNTGIAVTDPDEKLEVSGNVRLTSDNNVYYLGTDKDAGITYNGTNMVIDPDLVGSGALLINGPVRLQTPAVDNWADYVLVQSTLTDTTVKKAAVAELDVDSARASYKSDTTGGAARLGGKGKDYYDTLKNGVIATKLNISDTSVFMRDGQAIAQSQVTGLVDSLDKHADTLGKYKDHANLNNLNSANYTHLTATNHTDLTDGGATTLHRHDSVRVAGSVKVSDSTKANAPHGVTAEYYGLSNGTNQWKKGKITDTLNATTIRDELDVMSGANTVTLGANSGGGVVRTDATTKIARVGTAHYTNSELPAGVFYSYNDENKSSLMLGGGTTGQNAITDFRIYTGATSTTPFGTSRFAIGPAGKIRFVTTPPTYNDCAILTRKGDTVSVSSYTVDNIIDSLAAKLPLHGVADSAAVSGLSHSLRIPTETRVLTFADSADSILKITGIEYHPNSNITFPRFMLNDAALPWIFRKNGSGQTIGIGHGEGDNITADSGGLIWLIGKNYSNKVGVQINSGFDSSIVSIISGLDGRIINYAPFGSIFNLANDGMYYCANADTGTTQRLTTNLITQGEFVFGADSGKLTLYANDHSKGIAIENDVTRIDTLAVIDKRPTANATYFAVFDTLNDTLKVVHVDSITIGNVDSARASYKSDTTGGAARLGGKGKDYYDTLKNGVIATKLNISDTSVFMRDGQAIPLSDSTKANAPHGGTTNYYSVFNGVNKFKDGIISQTLSTISTANVDGIVIVSPTATEWTTDQFGLYVYRNKTGGITDASDYYYGIYNNTVFNQVDGVTDDFRGINNILRLDNGSVGTELSNSSSIGSYSILDLNGGTCWGNTYGAYISLDQEADNTINGNLYGHHLVIDADGSVTGDVIGLYLEEKSNVDYGIYQSGSAPNRLGGKLILSTTPRREGKLLVTYGDTVGESAISTGDLMLKAAVDDTMPHYISGTTNTYPIFTGANTVGDGSIKDTTMDGWPFTKFNNMPIMTQLVDQPLDTFVGIKDGVIIKATKENTGLLDSIAAKITGLVDSLDKHADTLSKYKDHTQLSNLNSSNYFHLTEAERINFTDGGSTTLHFHSGDRDRANHTGTQAISTVVGLSDSISAKLALHGKSDSSTISDSSKKAPVTGSNGGFVVKNGSALKTVSGVDSTEFKYLDGVTYAIQAQIEARDITSEATIACSIFDGATYRNWVSAKIITAGKMCTIVFPGKTTGVVSGALVMKCNASLPVASIENLTVPVIVWSESSSIFYASYVKIGDDHKLTFGISNGDLGVYNSSFTYATY